MNRKQRRSQAKTSPSIGRSTPAKIQGTFAEALQHHQAGRLAEAERLYQAVLLLEPRHSDSLHLSGLIAHQGGQNAAAVEMIVKAIDIDPGIALYHFNLGTVFQAAGRLEQAVLAFRQARRLDPLKAEICSNLGTALYELGRMDEAAQAFAWSICLSPGNATFYYNLGTALQELTRHREAVEAFNGAIRIAPNFPEAHFDLSLAHLTLGNFAAGWRELEWRWRGSRDQALRTFSQPQWLGQDIKGKSIFLHAEQGFGDTLQFCRYVPQVAALGATVLLEAPRPLLPLLARLPGVASLLATRDPPPAFDLHCPLMSLPGLFGTGIESIPAAVPYLRAGEKALVQWEERLGTARGLKVGLVWAGRPTYRRDRYRSVPFTALDPFWEIEGVTWYSLQMGDRRSDLSSRPSGQVMDLSPYLGDFNETAAALSQLDLVVTVDTAMAHLAGALGRPCWVMLPFFSDWRWQLDRTDSLWYPTLRLFRQSGRGNWTELASRVADALKNRSTEGPAIPAAGYN